MLSRSESESGYGSESTFGSGYGYGFRVWIMNARKKRGGMENRIVKDRERELL